MGGGVPKNTKKVFELCFELFLVGSGPLMMDTYKFVS